MNTELNSPQLTADIAVPRAMGIPLRVASMAPPSPPAAAVRSKKRVSGAERIEDVTISVSPHSGAKVKTLLWPELGYDQSQIYNYGSEGKEEVHDAGTFAESASLMMTRPQIWQPRGCF